jgi:hypothetical protein
VLILKTYSVQICQFPGNDNMTHPDPPNWLMRLVVEMKQDKRIGTIRTYCEGGTPITMLRNKAIFEALELGCDYSLMIDSDMGPDYLVGTDPSARPFWTVAWNFMMARRQAENIGQELPPATIAAPYCGPPPLEIPYIFRWKGQESDHPNPDHKLALIEREDAAMRSGIEEVGALPTGLILYDLRIFRKLPPPWFAYDYHVTPRKPPWWEGEWPDEGLNFQFHKSTTEDAWQTRNASLLGYPSYVAWDCWAIHHKRKKVGKPRIMTPDYISQEMRKALSCKYPTVDTRIHIVNRFDPLHAEACADPEPVLPGPSSVVERGGLVPDLGRDGQSNGCGCGGHREPESVGSQTEADRFRERYASLAPRQSEDIED